MDLSKQTDQQIDNLIENHIRYDKTAAPLFSQLLEERVRRGQEKQLLNFQTSMQLLIQTAIDQTCVSYGQLAKASGVEWIKARYQMNGAHGHLDKLLELCHARGYPLLTALVVNQQGLEDGELEHTALKGFCEAAHRLNIPVDDELAFHHQQRDASWQWGKENGSSALAAEQLKNGGEL